MKEPVVVLLRATAMQGFQGVPLLPLPWVRKRRTGNSRRKYLSAVDLFHVEGEHVGATLICRVCWVQSLMLLLQGFHTALMFIV